MKDVAKLIDDTLFQRALSGYEGSCMVVNKAGLELIDHPENLLEPLAQTVRRIDEEISSGKARLADYPGLDYVLGALLVHGARYGTEKVVPLLEGLNNAMKEEAIGAMLIFFHQIDGKPNHGVSRPEAYENFIREAVNSPSALLSRVAKRAMRFLD